MEDLLKAPEFDLGDTFTNLNVHKLYVEGLVSGYNVSDLENALKLSGDQKLEGKIMKKKLLMPNFLHLNNSF